MGIKTKIDWCDSSWNPVTGCKHECEYCYARRIAERFKGGCDFIAHGTPEPLTWVVDNPGKRENGQKAVYPFGFDPTFHRYKLDEPQRWKHPRNIFVCSMADLFGDWVPDEWIKAVFDACEAAPQHRYLFLTKNPERYRRLEKAGFLPRTVECWWGASTPHKADKYNIGEHTFVSIEPILEDFTMATQLHARWAIIGAETGHRKSKVVPKRDWIMPFVEMCEQQQTPVFMKESLRGLMGEDFRQEFPW